MKSGVPGSPLSAGPPFHAYQYVRTVPSARRFVIELRPLSLMRATACHPVVERRGMWCLLCASRHDLDMPIGTDLNADHAQAGTDHCFESPGHISLAEAGRPAGHGRSSKLWPTGSSAGLFSLR